MPLPSAPASISLNQVNVELGLSGTATISLNDAAVRTLFGVPSGQISMSQGYGKANFWKNSLTKGFFAGGQSPAAPTLSATADRTTYSTEATAAVPGANLSQARQAFTGAGDATKGFFAGGNVPGAGSVIANRTTYSTEATAAVAGANLSQARPARGAGNSTKGFFMGGFTFPSFGAVATADRTTYSTEATAAVPGANLPTGRYNHGCAGNNDKGFYAGGFTTARVATTDRTTWSTEASAAVPGANLSQARAQIAGAGDATKGFFYGGFVQPTAPIATTRTDRTTYSTEATAAVPGANLSQARYDMGAAGSDQKCFISGGATAPLVTTADRTTYSTETTAAVPGANLTAARGFHAAV